MLTRIPVRSELEHLGVYKPGKPIEEVKREFGLDRIIKLASNENPFGYSPLAKEAMLREMERTTLYPEATAPLVALKLAHQLSVDKSRILLGNGSDEIIRLITRSYIQSSDEAVMADVTFPRYETNVLIEGGTPVKVPLVDGVHDLEAMRNAITDRTKMVFVCNPNNPTGTIVGKEALQAFIDSVPEHVLLVVDEAYYEYVVDEDYLQTIPLLDTHPNLLILRTFSKVYGLAALRIGYAIAHPEIVEALTKVKDAFNTNRIAQAAALGALDDPAFVQLCCMRNRAGLEFMYSELEQLGLSWYPSQGNFLMILLPQSGDDVFYSLLKQGIIVRSGTQLDAYENTIRVSVGTDDENQAFIDALRNVLA